MSRLSGVCVGTLQCWSPLSYVGQGAAVTRGQCGRWPGAHTSCHHVNICHPPLRCLSGPHMVWTYLPVSLCPYHFCTTVQVSAALHPHVQIAPFSLTMGIIILFPATLHSLKRSKLLYIMQGWPLARARNNIATCCCCAVALNVWHLVTCPHNPEHNYAHFPLFARKILLMFSIFCENM